MGEERRDGDGEREKEGKIERPGTKVVARQVRIQTRMD